MSLLMIEPRCKNCGHMKIAHTIGLLCPKAELVVDEDGRNKWHWIGWLNTTYVPKGEEQ